MIKTPDNCRHRWAQYADRDITIRGAEFHLRRLGMTKIHRISFGAVIGYAEDGTRWALALEDENAAHWPSHSGNFAGDVLRNGDLYAHVADLTELEELE